MSLLTETYGPVKLVYPNTSAGLSGCSQLLLIDNAIEEPSIMANAVNSSTFPVTYSWGSSKTDLIALLREKFVSIDRIAIAFSCQQGKPQPFLDSQVFFNDEVSPYSENVAFIISLIKEFQVKHMDYLGCSTLKYDSWNHYYSILKETGVTVGASNDQTGNLKYGGNWVLESTGQDIEQVYFTEDIQYYPHVLDAFYSTLIYTLTRSIGFYAFGDILYYYTGTNIASISALNGESLYPSIKTVSGFKAMCIVYPYIYYVTSANTLFRVNVDGTGSVTYANNTTTTNTTHLLPYGDDFFCIGYSGTSPNFRMVMHKIDKLGNRTLPNVISNLYSPVLCADISGSYMYIRFDGTNGTNTNTIYQFNITGTPSVENTSNFLLTSFVAPRFKIYNDYLYVVSGSGTSFVLSKYSLLDGLIVEPKVATFTQTITNIDVYEKKMYFTYNTTKIIYVYNLDNEDNFYTLTLPAGALDETFYPYGNFLYYTLGTNPYTLNSISATNGAVAASNITQTNVGSLNARKMVVLNSVLYYWGSTGLGKIELDNTGTGVNNTIYPFTIPYMAENIHLLPYLDDFFVIGRIGNGNIYTTIMHKIDNKGIVKKLYVMNAIYGTGTSSYGYPSMADISGDYLYIFFYSDTATSGEGVTGNLHKFNISGDTATLVSNRFLTRGNTLVTSYLNSAFKIYNDSIYVHIKQYGHYVIKQYSLLDGSLLNSNVASLQYPVVYIGIYDNKMYLSPYNTTTVNPKTMYVYPLTTTPFIQDKFYRKLTYTVGLRHGFYAYRDILYYGTDTNFGSVSAITGELSNTINSAALSAILAMRIVYPYIYYVDGTNTLFRVNVDGTGSVTYANNTTTTNTTHLLPYGDDFFCIGYNGTYPAIRMLVHIIDKLGNRMLSNVISNLYSSVMCADISGSFMYIRFDGTNGTNTNNIYKFNITGTTATQVSNNFLSTSFNDIVFKIYNNYIYVVSGLGTSYVLRKYSLLDGTLVHPNIMNFTQTITNIDIYEKKMYLTSNVTKNIYVLNLDFFVCFKEDSLILTDQGYVPVQDLRKGDLVRTELNGYIPIDMIAKRVIYHPCTKERIQDQLYQCSSENYPEVFEPLIITGCHSILIDGYVDEEQIQKTIEVNGRLLITGEKFRLPACVDERATVYDKPGTYTIYHFALENDNYYFNYGVYANGLLVETCSKRFIKELSNMERIE